MRVIRRADIHRIDVLPLDQLPPIGFGGFISPLLRKLLDLPGIARTSRLQNRLIFQIKKIGHLPIRIRMRPPHESIADHPDVEFLHGSLDVEWALPTITSRLREKVPLTPPNL